MNRFLLIATVFIITACNQTTSRSNELESATWIVEKVTTPNAFLQKNDTIKFSISSHQCQINNHEGFKYISNDTVLLIDFPSEQKVFGIKKRKKNIKLSEQYCSTPFDLVIIPLNKQ